jgi:hypothetical protein
VTELLSHIINSFSTPLFSLGWVGVSLVVPRCFVDPLYLACSAASCFHCWPQSRAGRKKLVLVIMEHACPGQCGVVSRDLSFIKKHFAHSHRCQSDERILSLQQLQEELQRTRNPEQDSSIAVEEDVPLANTRLLFTGPLPEQDAIGETPAVESGLPSEEQQHIGAEDDGFPPADGEIEYPDDFVDGEIEHWGRPHGGVASDDAVHDFDSCASSVEPEEDFDTALDATWELLQDARSDFQWKDTPEEKEEEDDLSDMLELEEKEDDDHWSDTFQEEQPEESTVEQHVDPPPSPVNFPAGFEAPLPNQDDDDVHVEALLLALVQQFGCSLDGYQAIMEWAAFAQEKGYKFGRPEREKSRKAAMQRMIKRLGMEFLKPESLTIPLVDDSGPKVSSASRPASAPTSSASSAPKKSAVEATIPIVMYDFEELLDSLLTDKTMMVAENLLLNPDNPYAKYPSGGLLDDVLSGSWYHQTWKVLKLKEGDFLCPIIFFIDKTHTDHFGRFTLEPIRFTLGIFNRPTRALSKAWRTLGFLTDLQKGSSAQNSRNRVRTPTVPPEPLYPPDSFTNHFILLFARPSISKTTTEWRLSSCRILSESRKLEAWTTT